MAKAFARLALFLSVAFVVCSHAPEPRRLRVTADHRFLEYTDGAPFFYLGDTAWDIFIRLNRDEAAVYFANRAAKGFTVIQASVLASEGGVTTPNANGDLPLVNLDPAQPNEAYFKHVDALVREAKKWPLPAAR